ncbi:MAG: Gfo/Idh/MocA family oxidoreductase [Gemmatimonadota bacterium]|nr:MAG: Gfo/Idh/MocA family oxidoreductase [Gemmatimonadota bacterium]UCH26506.1 MAG: Gfo/Idh/MocA family oxidoreductase [Trueperaceae bacterium]
MLRIGIVGSDNSHALAYSKLANVDKIAGDTCRVVGIWGHEPSRTEEVARDGEIETIVSRPEELLGMVDAVIVDDRHGDLHREHALPFLEAGLPVYVDKPFAVSLTDCREMLAAAERSGALLSSFSPLRVAPATVAMAEQLEPKGTIKVAHFAGPCDFESQYAGPFFYATHVIEIALRLLGSEIERLRAVRVGKNVAVQLATSGGALASFSYLGDAAYHFHASLFGTDGMVAGEIVGGAGSYAEVLKAFLKMIETGRRPLDDQQLLHPIAVVHAVQASLSGGGREVEVATMLDGDRSS